MKKVLSLICVLALCISVFVGCGATEETTQSTATEGEATKKVVLIGNQKFGDQGPMDDMAAGLERACTEFGYEMKTMESEPMTFEDDIRSMANEGYDMIITTFPYMSDSTKIIAQEFPDIKFVAVFQKINTGEEKYDNIMDMEFQGQTTLYVDGYMAGLATQTDKIGIIIGGEEPSPNSEGNGFMMGVRDANPDATVEFSYASYEDTAAVKEVALAMIDRGVDFIQGDCGAADSGIMEAINETGGVANGFSVIMDFTEMSDNFCGSIGMGYGDAVYDGVKAMHDETFVGGVTDIRDISNNGYFLDWPTYEAFAERSEQYGEVYAQAIVEGKRIEQEIKDGTTVIEQIFDVPNWEAIKNR